MEKMTFLIKFLLLIFLSLSIYANQVFASSSNNVGSEDKIRTEKKNYTSNEVLKISKLKKVNKNVVLEDHALLFRLKEKLENEMFRSGFEDNQSCITKNENRIFKDLKKAEGYLRCLLKEKEILAGDFYGINLTAYRYVNVFDRMGYIRYKITQIDREIKKTNLKIYEFKKTLSIGS